MKPRRLALALLLAGCSNTHISGPMPDAGGYGLVGVENQARPAVVFEGLIPVEGGTALLRITADSGWIALEPLGEYEHRVWHTVTVDGVPEPPFTWTDRGIWTSQGNGSLSFVSGLYEGVSFHGTRDFTRLDLEQDLVGEGEVVEYQYVK